jgi:hypothetical protein
VTQDRDKSRALVKEAMKILIPSMQRISSLAEELLDFQEGFHSMQLGSDYWLICNTNHP